MILKISWDKADVIDRADSFVLLKVPFYGKFAVMAALFTMKGETLMDYRNSKENLSNKRVFIGQHGGLSIE